MDHQAQSTCFLGSDLSSIHSNDSLSSSTNSTGTQVHHRSHAQPRIGGMPRENAQNFALPSTVSLPDPDEAPEADSHTPSSPPAQYRFETPEEAAERRRRVTSLTRRALIDTQRNIEDYSSSGGSRGPSVEGSRVSTHRGLPAQSRRRPRATSTGSISMQEVAEDPSKPLPFDATATNGRGDLEKGYVNGDFITITKAGGLAELSKPKTRKRDLLKRIFCIYH